MFVNASASNDFECHAAKTAATVPNATIIGSQKADAGIAGDIRAKEVNQAGLAMWEEAQVFGRANVYPGIIRSM